MVQIEMQNGEELMFRQTDDGEFEISLIKGSQILRIWRLKYEQMHHVAAEVLSFISKMPVEEVIELVKTCSREGEVIPFPRGR